MAKAGLPEEFATIEEFLQCMICFEPFTHPKMLQCGHTFCYECLEGCVNAYIETYHRQPPTIACPTCRYLTIFPTNGVVGLPTDFKLNRIKEVLQTVQLGQSKKSQVCEFCQMKKRKTVSEFYCTECGKNFCHSCLKKHDKNPTFKKHHSIHLGHEASAMLFCKTHNGEIINHFCRSCHTVLCTWCVMTHNSHHRIIEMQQALKLFKDTLKDALKVISIKHKDLLLRRDQLEQERVKLVLYEEARNSIEQEAEKVVQQIRKQEKELLKQLEKLQDFQGKNITTEVENTDFYLVNMDSLSDHVNRMIQRSHPLQLLAEYEELVQRMKTLGEVDLPTLPKFTTTGVKFVPDAENQVKCVLGELLVYDLVSGEAEMPESMGITYTMERAEPDGSELIRRNSLRKSPKQSPKLPRKPSHHASDGELQHEHRELVRRSSSRRSQRPSIKPQLLPSNSTSMTHAPHSSIPSAEEKQPQHASAAALINRLTEKASEAPMSGLAQQVKMKKIAWVPTPPSVNKNKPPSPTSSTSSELVIPATREPTVIIPTTLQWQMAKVGRDPGEVKSPRGVAFLPCGKLVVADCGNYRLQILTEDGHFDRTIGQHHGITPHGIVVTSQTDIAITDPNGQDVKIFSDTGILVGFWGKGMFKWPSGITTNRSGQFIVADYRRHIVSVHTPDGHVTKQFGSQGKDDNQLYYPLHVTTDRHNNIIVSDFGNNAVKVFDPDGMFLFKLGGEGSEDGKLRCPHGVCVDENDNVIVADCLNHRVSVFSLKYKRFERHLLTQHDGLHYPSGLAIQGAQLALTEYYKDECNTVKLFKF